MKHYGDITKLSGYELPIVDVITGGSPCQDLSVAGKREGLAGERSGLFMEQIRIVKEMRDHDRRANGRSDITCRPRYMVWENVPGAFSINGGKDFQAVLTEIVRIAEPGAPDVPLFGGGKRWDKSGCLYDQMGCWSVAWRVHDAQFWGVPQRRKRIALVADFGGLTAPEVLFEREGLQWDFEQGEEEREEIAGSAGRSVETTGGGINVLNDKGGSVMSVSEDVTGALRSEEHGHQTVIGYDAYQHHGYRENDTVNPLTKDQNNSVRGDTPLICYGIDQQGGKGGANYAENVIPTMQSDSHGTPHAVCYGIGSYNSEGMKSGNPAAGIYEADTSWTLDNNGGNPACNQGGVAVVTGAYCLQGNGIDRADNAGCNGKGWREDQCYTLNTIDRPAVLAIDRQTDRQTEQPLMIEMTSTKNTVITDGISTTLTARMGTGGNQVNVLLEH